MSLYIYRGGFSLCSGSSLITTIRLVLLRESRFLSGAANFGGCRLITTQKTPEVFESRYSPGIFRDKRISCAYENISKEGQLPNASCSIENSVQRIKLFTHTNTKPNNSSIKDLIVDEDLEEGITSKLLYIKSQLIQIYNIISISASSADSKFTILYEHDRRNVISLLKPGLLNEFIKYYLEENSENGLIKARVWYSRFKEFNISKTLDTYYLFFSYYVKNGMYDEVKELIDSMHRDDLYTAILFQNFLEYEPELRLRLDEVIKSIEPYPYKELENWIGDEVKITKSSSSTNVESVLNTTAKSPDNISSVAVLEYANLPNKEGHDRDLAGIERLSKLFASLNNFKCNSPWEHQIYIECISHMAAHDRILNTPGSNNNYSSKKDVKQLISNWIGVIVDEIEEEVNKFELDSAKNQDAIMILIFLLKYMKVEDIAMISINSLISLISTCIFNTPNPRKVSKIKIKYTNASMHIGQALKDSIRFYNITTIHSGLGLKVRGAISKFSDQKCLSDGRIRRRLGRMDELINGNTELAFHWSPSITLSVGALLLDVMIDNLKIFSENHYTPSEVTKQHPESMLIEHSILKEENSIKTYGYILVKCDNFTNLLDSSTIPPMNLPMIIKPMPWTNPNNGGYISNNKSIMLNPFSDSIKALQIFYKSGDLDTVLRAIDVLSAISWTINEHTLKVAEYFYNNDQVSVFNCNDISPKIDTTNNLDPYIDFENDIQEIKEKSSKNDVEEIRKLQGLYSKMSEAGYKITIAKGLLGKLFYFPFNIDFRGRAYPAPVYLNHCSNDLSRGLLLFGVKKKLGSRGLYWLKLQIASHAGCGRLNFEERLKFTNENINNIIDSAKAPINGKRWWIQFESRWQLLACCIELHKAIESGIPEDYESGIHVHKDGTCNGIQHYAALSRDVNLAKMVNLINDDNPNDVYSYILNSLTKRINADIQNNEILAPLALQFVQRKLIKQTVMTVPYGVTYFGAVNQINDNISEEDLENALCRVPNYREIRSKNLSYIRKDLCKYLARLTFDAIDESYNPAVKVQKWLMQCAEKIIKSIGINELSEFDFMKCQLMQELGYIKPSQMLQDYENNVINCDNDDMCYSPKSSNIIHNSINSKNTNQDIIASRINSVHNERERTSMKFFTSYERELNNRSTYNSDLFNNIVRWTSPLGLPIVQPYRINKTKRILIPTKNQTITYNNSYNSRKLFSGLRSQITSFPPNFVHSLDASHMMLTALICSEQGIVFASVHDSYWTHPSDIDVLDKAIACCFVKLYNCDILENLRYELITNYFGRYYEKSIVISNPEHIEKIKNFLKSHKRYTKSKKTELLNIKVYVPFDIDPAPVNTSLNINTVLNSKYLFN